jgi:hypothetical protein
MSEISALEILECAKINFENVEKMNPTLLLHPIYLLAKEQLNNGIKKLEEK